MSFDRDKYRRMFIEEAREGLRSLNNDLVSLEKLLERPTTEVTAARARDVMDAAFRTAHSLKGMGAAMGYATFAELAHRLEDLADLARQGKSIGAEGFDLLLEGSDKLEEMVERVAEGHDDLDVGDLPSRLQIFVQAVRQVNAQPPSTTAPPTVVPTPVEGAPGKVSVRVKIADDASLPQVRAFVVHRALSALRGYLETDPPPDALRTKELPDRTLVVRFDAEVADLEEIERVARAQQSVADVVVQAHEQPAAQPKLEERDGAQPTPASGEDDRTVRVRTVLLDEFIDSVGELLLARSKMRALAVQADSPELFDLVDEVDRLTRDLHARVVAARMTPLTFLTERFPRVVRDLARRTHKTVDFRMSGTEIELDRAILDELGAPFLHMLRNAVDHAHEGDDARAARGKQRAMKLELRASRDRDTVLLELEDDGGGIDPEKNKRRVVERGLMSQTQAEALTDEQAIELVCLPGFSTVEAVTDTSGRGVGMDVVKATLERLGGSLRIHSTPGRGTRFVLQLPLTVAIIQVLVVEAGARGDRDAYAIPVNRVEKALDLDPSAISTAHGRSYMKAGGDLVPLFDLGQELGYGPPKSARGGTVIVVGRGSDISGLRVDAIVGQEEVVAKPLGPPLSGLGYLAGATLLADGRAAFILDPLRLVRAESADRAGVDQSGPPPVTSRR